MTPPAFEFKIPEFIDIHHATLECISSLEACLSVKPLMKESWAESRLADLNLWASSVGALARHETSLDRRLQFQPKPRLVLTSLLLTLQTFIDSCRMHAAVETHGEKLNDKAGFEDTPASTTEKTLESTLADDLEQGSSSASWFIALGSSLETASDTSSDSNAGDGPVEQHSEATLKRAMKDTDDIIDQLIILGFAIRRSGTAARLQRADASFNPNENEDLGTHLEFILLNDPAKRRKNKGHDGGTTDVIRMPEAEDGFGKVTPEQQHLILANLRRRHRFKYARRHQQKLDQPIAQPSIGLSKRSSRTPEDGQESPLRDCASDDREPSPMEDSTGTLGIPQASEMSATTPSAVEGGILKMAIPSQAAASRVSVSVATIHYPSPPPITKQMRGFKCPCCYQTLPEMFQDWSRWRKHLTEDLCPYTCPFLECPKPEVLYISRTVWRDHVLETHGAGHYWECLACAGTGVPNSFPTAEEFVSHNRTQHQDTISEDQITDLQSSCRKVALPNISQCPLCPWPQDEMVVPDAAANLEHVGNCIHEFSLNALPWAEALDVGATNTASPIHQKVQKWLIKSTGEPEGVDIQKIDIKTFGVLPVPPRPRKQEGVYVPEEYFAESSKESFKVEQGSLSLDFDLPEDESESGYTYEGDGLVPIVDHEGVTLGSLLRFYAIPGIDGRYWTPKLLRHILFRDRVEAEVKKTKPSWGAWDVPQLVDAVYPKDDSLGTKSYLRVFALLALAERVGDLAKFIRDGVCDEKLPIAITKLRTRWLVCLERDKSKPLECFEGWSENDKECFERNQWSVMAPFFDLTKERTYKKFHLHRKTCRPWRKLKESAALESYGAFGEVTVVEFHPTSHSFHNVPPRIKLDRSILAIKTLHDARFNDEQQFRTELDQQFRTELDQLKRSSGFVHEHLMTTLGAFKQGNQWNFIFPIAVYSLDMYLEQQNPPWNHKTVCWASKQLWGLMGALDTIHNPRYLHISDKGERRYGRHGDINCDNILCFQAADASDLYVLVISDFGLSDFNRNTSRFDIPNQRIPATPGYRPPECDIKGGLISRAYDIWAMGCLFLEFLTWFLGGPACLDEFRHKRRTIFITGSITDIFFDLMTCEEEGPGVYVAQVKLEVTEWIQRLRRDKHCSRFIHDVLDLIQMEMLVVLENNEGQSSGKRSSSGELKDKLERIRHECVKEGDNDYGTLGVPEDKDPLTVPAVEVALNEIATKMILEQKPQLKDYKGKKKKSMLSDQFKEIDN